MSGLIMIGNLHLSKKYLRWLKDQVVRDEFKAASLLGGYGDN
jgi:hypothetical protein